MKIAQDAPKNNKDILERKNLRFAESNGDGVRLSKVLDMMVFERQRRKTVALQYTAKEYELSAEELNDAAKRMEAAINVVVQAEKTASERAKVSISRAKDTVAQLGSALDRVNKLLGSDFESRLVQVERLVDALTKLDELNRGGRLQGVMQAIGKADF